MGLRAKDNIGELCRKEGIPYIGGADNGIPTIDDPYTVNYAGTIFRGGSHLNRRCLLSRR